MKKRKSLTSRMLKTGHLMNLIDNAEIFSVAFCS